jgi:tRNA A-37 threonylcarbamoyl transferase component Bud32
MIQCPKCSADNSDDSRFCKSCAEPLSSLSQAPTVAAPEGDIAPAPVQSPRVGRIVSSDSVPAGGFTPGTILADRYRIIGLLGRGGMGEVYRADDLKLGQPVALKFLPPALADDSVRRERFFAEVRITRQLSHPNICRVYDIGEVDGRHFLSMEYIDGEDLASLMKRIGHLSNEKALDIARQLVAGLTVAHERGVLHRDLKPANIMLDGHGRVRITDFGLAIAVGDESQVEEIAGTPAYMAPEQLAGKGATVRSDIYSLGLILYEIYTGRKAFTAKTLAELREQKETQTPRAPSEIREGIDPVVERVIQRCMEKDPNARPASVAQLAQALPGGDPLAAAIAAGETPSPEMVAASGSKEGLRPLVAWSCLALFIVGICVVALMKRQYALYELVPIKYKPDVLEAKARDILKDLGYSDEPADSAFGFEPNIAYFEYVEKNNQSSDRFDTLPTYAIQFWYRQAPFSLVHQAPISMTEQRSLTLTDPPLMKRGEAAVILDASGNLTDLRIIPSEQAEYLDTEAVPNWSVLFEASGLEEINDQEPDQTYLAYDDMRAAWTAGLTDHLNKPIQIEAAAWQGKPVSWHVTKPYAENNTEPIPIIRVIIMITVLIAILLGGSIFALRNLRRGRGDRRGAARLAWFYFGLGLFAWVFIEHHVAALNELALSSRTIGSFLIASGVLWLMYMAIEPFVRRRWPVVLVGWNRLLRGDLRDPLVGRDLLLGAVLGTFGTLMYYLCYPLAALFNASQIRPSIGSQIGEYLGTLNLFTGTNVFIGSILFYLMISISVALSIGFLMFLVRVLLRRTWITIITLMVLLTVFFSSDESSLIFLIPAALTSGALIFIYFRFGLLSLVVSFFFGNSLAAFPITTQFSAWHSGIGITGLALLLAFTLYAFYYSLGGRPMFGAPRLDD